MLTQIIDLQKSGKLSEARKVSADFARKFPGNPAARASTLTMSGLEQVASSRTLKYDKQRGFIGAMKGVDTSSIPPASDYEGPRDPELRKRLQERKDRYTGSSVKLSAKEKAIVAALNTPISVNFKGDKFQDVIEYLATVTNQPILLDKQDAKDASIDYDSPVNLSVKGVTVRTVLRKILAEYGLTFVVKEETIQIVSVQKAREMMTTRAYPVADLITFSNFGNFGGVPATAFDIMVNTARLIDTIQQTVDPQSWQINGGPGSIYFDAGTMSLVVRQSAEVHAMMGNSYGGR
jgi:hypothetical protein